MQMLKTKPYLTWTDETSAAAGCVEKATRICIFKKRGLGS